MTMSPIDTDALRKHIAINANSDKTIRRVFAAADELDRLRIILADAPHDTWCASHDWGNDNHAADARPCDCWKADAP